MSHKDNGDTRSTGEGGWFYAENELFSVFAPLIGADGVAVYMAMCRLIPLAAVDQDRQVTTRAVSEASTVSRAQTNRKMADIVRLGMIEEIRQAKNRASAYKLLPLRELSLVGIVELQRRLAGVPQGDTTQRPSSIDGFPRDAAIDIASVVGGVIESLSASAESFELTVAPAASGESGVPPWDTEAKGEQNEPVSQKTASVSQNQPSVSQKTASVSQNRGPYKEEEKEEEEDKYPPTPVPGALGVSGSSGRDAQLVLPDPDCRPGEANFPINAGIAARWVLRRCGISNSRMERPVISALSLRMTEARDETLFDLATLAAENYLAYQDAEERGELRVRVSERNFFAAQGFWHSRKSWSRKIEARTADAGVGMHKPVDPEQERLREEERRQRVAAYFDGNAALLVAGGYDDLGKKLNEIREEHLAGLDLDAVEKKLADLEDELFDAMKSQLTDEESEAMRKQISTELNALPTFHRMNASQRDQVRTQVLRKKLHELKAMPRLSTFYLNGGR